MEKKKQKVDRVVLSPESLVIVRNMMDQVKNVLGDLVNLTQKDTVNFLIQERASEFSSNEISKIRSTHFDIVRALKKATEEAIKAKSDGDDIQIDALLKIIQTPSVNKNGLPKMPRKPKKSTQAKPGALNKFASNLVDTDAPNPPIIDESKIVHS